MSKQLVHEIRFGLIKGEIYLAHTANGDRYDVSFVRLFRNGDKWQESTRFGRDDLPLVAKIADMAHSWIYLKSQKRTGAEVASEEVVHERGGS